MYKLHYLYNCVLLFYVQTIACEQYMRDKKSVCSWNTISKGQTIGALVKRIRCPHNKDNKDIGKQRTGGTIVNYNSER